MRVLLVAAALIFTSCAGIASPAAGTATPEGAAVGGRSAPSTLVPATATADPTAPAGTTDATAAPVRTADPTAVPVRTTAPVATSTPLKTAAATVTSQPTTRVAAYVTLAPGSALPSDQQCASEIAKDPWEPRPENRAANNANAWTSGFRLRGSYLASIAPGYEERVTGNFTGTTDQIIRWGACKWGFDENDVRAQAVIESFWKQSLMADCNVRSQPETNGCASVGLLSVKGANIPATHPGTWPAAMTSTAFNVDYALAVRRLCYDGKETWMRQFNASYGAGDVWGCIGRWYSGRWHDSGAETYIARVRATLNAKTWLTPTF